MSTSACTASACPTIFCRSAFSKWHETELRFVVSNSLRCPHCAAVAITPPSLLRIGINGEVILTSDLVKWAADVSYAAPPDQPAALCRIGAAKTSRHQRL